MPHGAPIPNGCKIGNLVYSSGIVGRDLETGKIPTDLDEQARCMFANVRKFIELAGGTPNDIAKVTVFMNDENQREPINKEWIKMFPDEHSRPARHALQSTVRGGAAFQVEVIAVL